MTNVLIASDARGAAVKLNASTANVTLSKCTIVGGGDYAVRIEDGHCANIGYDAGLAIASKSDLGNPPVPGALAVYAYPPTNITETTACARGEVSAPATLSIA